MLKGPDVSSYQGDIDYSKLKVDFIICKATEGVGFRDPKLTRNQTEARKSGVSLGYYHFARPDLGNTAEAEADYFLSQIGEIRGGEMFFLDFEVSFVDRVNWCKKWLDRVAAKLSGYKCPIYLNQSLMNGSDWKSVINAGYGLWLAKYDYNADAPVPATPWPVLAFRQYSNKEVFAGIPSSAVDANVFYGDKEALKAYGYQLVVAPPANVIELDKDIPTFVEDKFDLKSKDWYSKYWTLADFINDSIKTHLSLDNLEEKYKDLDKLNKQNEAIIDKDVETFKAKDLQISTLQKSNSELTSQLTVAGDQVKLAVEEKNAAVDDKNAAEAAQKTAENNLKIANDKIKSLELKLTQGLKGYSRGQLFRAWFFGA